MAPTVSPTAWIAAAATLAGDLRVEDETSIRCGAVLRADFGIIVVRRGANVQDPRVCRALARRHAAGVQPA
jgi:carbonic anhydrase/acetyltransferase-like protein (isoleucine patch superfamily)